MWFFIRLSIRSRATHFIMFVKLVLFYSNRIEKFFAIFMMVFPILLDIVLKFIGVEVDGSRFQCYDFIWNSSKKWIWTHGWKKITKWINAYHMSAFIYLWSQNSFMRLNLKWIFFPGKFVSISRTVRFVSPNNCNSNFS